MFVKQYGTGRIRQHACDAEVGVGSAPCACAGGRISFHFFHFQFLRFTFLKDFQNLGSPILDFHFFVGGYML